jgi:hypothetical protein
MSGRGTNFPIFLHLDISQIFSHEEKDGGIFKTSGCKIVFEGIYTLDYTDFNK